MKTMKKFAALLLVVVLMAAMLVVPANAAGGTLTIKDALNGVEYNLYKIFDLETDGTTAYAYTVNAAWSDFFTTGAGKDLIKMDGNYVAGIGSDGLNSEAARAALAKAVEEYAQGADGKAGGTDDKVAPSDSEDGTGADLVFTLAEDGYYVVGTSLNNQAAFGASVSGNSDTPVKEKNALPTIDKTSTGSAGVGDTVNYTITIKVEGNVDADYIVVDNMSEGKLEYVAGSLTITGIDAGKVTVVYPFDNGITTKAMKLILDRDALDALDAGAEVKITYDAVVVEAGEIKNKVELNGSTGTPGDDEGESTTYNYNIDITKKAQSETGNDLPGAKFVLTNADGKYAKHDGTKFTGWMEAAAAKPATEYVDAVIWTSDANGKININGVPAGTYTLEEIEAPDGYKLAADTTITITDADKDGKIDETSEDSSNTIAVTVVNKTGGVFPETGGIGTTIFYCLGGVLVLAAVVFLVSKKRMIED